MRVPDSDAAIDLAGDPARVTRATNELELTEWFACMGGLIVTVILIVLLLRLLGVV